LNEPRPAGALAATAALFAVILLVVVGCGSGAPDTTSTGAGSAAALYAANCASCHGRDLRGTGKGPSHLSVDYEPSHHPDASFRRAIEQGVQAHRWNVGDMQPVPDLDRAEIDAIIAYIRDVQTREGLEPYPPE
jgi:mono/diheme cytochrome c family protein